MIEGAALTVSDLYVGYGPIKAVRGCSFFVRKGQSVAIVGANGAGKTTILRAISKMLPISKGSILMNGRDIRAETPYGIARKGLLHVPEGRGVLPTMTVFENLQISYDVRPTDVPFEQALDRVLTRFPRIKERLTQRAGNMSGGEQQMLALARAIMNPPDVLLVDEPSLGLSPTMVKEAYRTLLEFKQSGISMLLVEQNIRVALRFADYAYVLRNGEIVAAKKSDMLLADGELISHYLGGAGHN